MKQQKSIKTFERLFYSKLEEDMSAGAGGVFGDAPSMGHGGDFSNTDFYAPGDTRIPKGGKKKKKKNSKKKKHDGSIEPLVPTQKRYLGSSM